MVLANLANSWYRTTIPKVQRFDGVRVSRSAPLKETIWNARTQNLMDQDFLTEETKRMPLLKVGEPKLPNDTIKIG